MHVVAAKAVAFKEARGKAFQDYGKKVVQNARALAHGLQDCGLPLVTGGTDNHLLLMDLSNHSLNGKQAQEVLEKAGITVNKNTIPGDTRSPLLASGIRLGTPALTTRGMGTGEMKQIATWIHQALNHSENEGHLNHIRQEISQLCKNFPCP